RRRLAVNHPTAIADRLDLRGRSRDIKRRLLTMGEPNTCTELFRRLARGCFISSASFDQVVDLPMPARELTLTPRGDRQPRFLEVLPERRDWRAAPLHRQMLRCNLPERGFQPRDHPVRACPVRDDLTADPALCVPERQ